MTEYDERKELYVGCDCLDLDHISHFLHYPLSKEEKEDGEQEVIYCRVKIKNYLNEMCPPLRYFYSSYDWGSYFRYNWLRRIGIASKYIFNSFYVRRWGIFDCFNFQEKDLIKIDAFLSLISSDIDTNINEAYKYWVDDDCWLIRFDIDRIEWDGEGNNPFSWDLGLSPQFKKRKLFGRIKYAFKYMFGRHSDEQDIHIYKKDAAKLRGMIKWVQENNKKEENN